jgi:hypothetical protein
MNRYSKYWKEQFDTLAVTLAQLDARPAALPPRRGGGKRPSRPK